MKPLKYTVAALAIIAAASFTSSAMAQTTSNTGDVILGLYDANTSSSTVANSLEFDLGSFSSLTPGESWNLGTTIETTYSSDSAADLQFAIVASAGNSTSNGGLSKAEIAFTAPVAPTATNLSTSTSNDIATLEATLNGQTVTASGSGYQAAILPNGTAGSFDSTGYASTGFASGETMVSGYPATGSVIDFYTQNHTGAATLDGTFEFTDVGDNDILTFDPTAAVPEPSAYALGLCAVALFFVLKRRKSVA